ncbi:hypothetical protein LXL04_017109 [Taraxacum kok-saghyz]
MLDELDSSKDHTVKVRILRLWKNTSWDNKKDIRSISMILIDEKGSKIKCNVKKLFYIKYLELFEEYVVVYIQNSTLGTHLGNMKYVDNVKQMHFKIDTTPTKCNDFDGPTHGFSFANFQSILDNSLPFNLTVDVIGKVVNIPPLEKLKGQNQDTLQQNVDLKDLRQQVFNIIIQFGKIRIFNVTYVNNSMIGTKIFCNSNVEEINSFKKNLPTNIFVYRLYSLKAFDNSSSSRTIDEFMVKNPLYNIPSLHEIESHLDDTHVSNQNVNCSQLSSSYSNEFVCTTDKCRNIKVTAKPTLLVKVRVEGKPNFKIFRKKSSKALQKYLNQIFGDAVTSGENYVTLSMDPINDMYRVIIDMKSREGGDVTLADAKTSDGALFSPYPNNKLILKI